MLNRLWAKISSLVCFCVVFLINFFLIICFECIFVYTLSVPEMITDYGESWLRPDFQSMSFFADKEVLDSVANISGGYFVMFEEEGSKQLVKFDRHAFLKRLSADKVLNVNTGDRISFKHFLGNDVLLVNDDSLNLQSIGGYLPFSAVVAMYVCVVFLVVWLEYSVIGIFRKRANI